MIKRFLILVIRWYQYISSILVQQHVPHFAWSGCRQWPTCSVYALNAIEQEGVVRGCAQSVIRVLRCNVFFS